MPKVALGSSKTNSEPLSSIKLPTYKMLLSSHVSIRCKNVRRACDS